MTRAGCAARAGVAVLLALLVGAAAAPVAVAHGGSELIATTVGPYQARLFASPVVAPAAGYSPQVDLTLYLHARRDGAPVTDAAVRVTVCTEDGCFGPEPARRVANSYEVMLSQPTRGAWAGWTLTFQISGPAGDAELSYPADRVGPSWWAAVALGAGGTALVGALALLGLRVRRLQRLEANP